MVLVKNNGGKAYDPTKAHLKNLSRQFRDVNLNILSNIVKGELFKTIIRFYHFKGHQSDEFYNIFSRGT